jgi:PAS domain-containing protein
VAAQTQTPPRLLQAAHILSSPQGRDYTATAVLGALLLVALGLMWRLDYLQTRWQDTLQQDAAVTAALNESATGTIVFDATGRIVASNKAARDLLGISPDSRHTIHEFHKLEARARIDRLIGTVLAQVQLSQRAHKYYIDCRIPVPIDGGQRAEPRPFQILVRVAPQMLSTPHIIAFITPQEPTLAIVPQPQKPNDAAAMHVPEFVPLTIP